ncbi:MAG: acyl-CoA dehydrogenase [bacterium]|nr:acyl-CoA dehydrogenase [bacterium]
MTAFGFSDWMKRAEEVSPLVAAEADEAESLRHMTDRTVEAFKESELYYLTLPQELGGPDLPLVESLEVLEKVSEADGAAGWCLFVGNIEVGTAGAYLADAGIETVFTKPKDLLISGQGIPNGVARPVDGGYRIDGDWKYGSGIHHADYIHNGCIVLDEDGNPRMTDAGKREIRICLTERKDAEIKDDWHVLGLCATGSFDYSIRDVFVPAEMTHDFATTKPHRGSYQFTLGLTGYTTWGHTGFALGVGRHALDELKKLAQTKENPFGLLGDGASFQVRYAHAEGSLRAARAFCYTAWDDLCESMARQEPASLDQIALIRLAMSNVHDVVSDITTFAHIAGGGVSLRHSPLQRCYRDMHAGTQHILLADQIRQDTAKVLLGMAPENARWSPLGLEAPSA